MRGRMPAGTLIRMPAGPASFEVTDSPATTIKITGQDGQKYEVKMALVITSAFDTGQVNPLDGMPMFQLPVQVAVQIKKVDDA